MFFKPNEFLDEYQKTSFTASRPSNIETNFFNRYWEAIICINVKKSSSNYIKIIEDCRALSSFTDSPRSINRPKMFVSIFGAGSKNEVFR